MSLQQNWWALGRRKKERKKEKDIAKRRRMTQGLTVSLSTDVTLNTLGLKIGWNLYGSWVWKNCFSLSPNADTNIALYNTGTVL